MIILGDFPLNPHIGSSREELSLWDDKPGLDLKQAWFAGVHSDVGGGYTEAGLSHCACQWMLREAEGLGLRFESHLADSLTPDSGDMLHNE